MESKKDVPLLTERMNSFKKISYIQLSNKKTGKTIVLPPAITDIEECAHAHGYFEVINKKGLKNFLDPCGNVLSSIWFRKIFPFDVLGFARVQRKSDELWNFLNLKGEILSKNWYYSVDAFYNGFAPVQRKDRLWNFIDSSGKLISKRWFVSVYGFENGFAKVEGENDFFNFINAYGCFSSRTWFTFVSDFDFNGIAAVQRQDDKWNIIRNGFCQPECKSWYDSDPRDAEETV